MIVFARHAHSEVGNTFNCQFVTWMQVDHSDYNSLQGQKICCLPNRPNRSWVYSSLVFNTLTVVPLWR